MRMRGQPTWPSHLASALRESVSNPLSRQSCGRHHHRRRRRRLRRRHHHRRRRRCHHHRRRRRRHPRRHRVRRPALAHRRPRRQRRLSHRPCNHLRIGRCRRRRRRRRPCHVLIWITVLIWSRPFLIWIAVLVWSRPFRRRHPRRCSRRSLHNASLSRSRSRTRHLWAPCWAWGSSSRSLSAALRAGSSCRDEGLPSSSHEPLPLRPLTGLPCFWSCPCTRCPCSSSTHRRRRCTRLRTFLIWMARSRCRRRRCCMRSSEAPRYVAGSRPPRPPRPPRRCRRGRQVISILIWITVLIWIAVLIWSRQVTSILIWSRQVSSILIWSRQVSSIPPRSHPRARGRRHNPRP